MKRAHITTGNRYLAILDDAETHVDVYVGIDWAGKWAWKDGQILACIDNAGGRLVVPNTMLEKLAAKLRAAEQEARPPC